MCEVFDIKPLENKYILESLSSGKKGKKNKEKEENKEKERVTNEVKDLLY